MPARDSESPEESYFNDLTQQAPDANCDEQSPTQANSQDAVNDNAAKQKRIACVLCRKRKLRCDGARPTCATCKRLSHDCAYDEVRKKSGPKRGYVKLLEQRLQQVETLLKSQDSTDSTKDTTRQDSTAAYVANTIQQGASSTRTQSSNLLDSRTASVPANRNDAAVPGDNDFQWELIGLGLEEPLPPQDVMDELYEIYFAKMHPSMPVIHRPRFMAALNLAPHMRPPVCLRYSMWTMAASVTDKYLELQEHFYHRARKYAQLDEMRGHGESTITVAHCQAWTLLGSYEFKNLYFPRAWLSSGRASRLALMMQLHRLDGAGLDVKQCLPPPKDWTEREERRRTFWMCFAVDRYASIGTGWPMTIDERDVLTNLPASDDAFDRSKPMATGSLDQACNPMGATKLESMGGIVLTAAMFGRNLLHLHRPTAEDNDSDLNGAFWTRHRQLEQILLQTSLHLPDHMRLPGGRDDPNVVFTNMCIHTSTICLHQASIFKADKYQLPASVGNESKVRCVTAAAEIASIMRTISHMDLSAMNPFIAFCVYVAARVFVQYIKTRPNDQQMNSSLQFLLQAMQALRRKNPLTESFLVQLDLDLEGAGIQRPYMPLEKKNSVIPVNTDPVGCNSIYEIRETQNQNAPINQFAGRPSSTSATPQFPGNHQQPLDNHQPPPLFGASVIDTAPQTVQFMPVRNLQDLSQDFSPQRSTGGTAFIFNEHTTTDMDLTGDQPSPSTINSQSRGGSTSQSSYSPAQQEHHLPYRASPHFTPSQTPSQLQSHMQASTASLAPLYAANNAMSSNNNDLHMSAYPSDAIHNGAYDNGFDWEFSGMGAEMSMGGEMGLGADMDAGMTPGTWNNMLETVMDGVPMGWDVLGTPHGANVDVPGSRRER
ncbi:binuclear zinc transcription factor [Boeremia exigua]|uniref:binuclear zinc transcription factor n=1 Tax=Boeremia exigua TaxID=749465 RepID=UPI001E8CE93B|nr:binuclear zinc transcription factor [Boeremia exigua]KAH6615367.1 binuclear zinc transcription factor [Boeremia exigua]